MTKANEYINELIDAAKQKWNDRLTITECNTIPESIPLEKPVWLKIENVTAVFADMTGSTQFSTREHARAVTTGRVYESFISNWVRVMNEFGVSYIDIQGDGALGIWDGDGCRYPAFCAAVTFKTFVDRWLNPWIKEKTDIEEEVHVHIGMDEYNVLVKRVGMRGEDNNKEIWAGHPINIAASLATIAGPDELIASGRLYDAFEEDAIYKSCECNADKDTGEHPLLWEEIDLESINLGIDAAWNMKAHWCEIHGTEYCDKIMENAS